MALNLPIALLPSFVTLKCDDKNYVLYFRAEKNLMLCSTFLYAHTKKVAS